MRIGIIVEGHGEVEAFPILVRRLLARHGITDVEIPRPWRLPKGKMMRQDELARTVEMVARKTSPGGALLILLDADDDCPAELGLRVLECVRRVRNDRPLSVVVAKREFEAWFLGAAESLRGQRGLPSDLSRRNRLKRYAMPRDGLIQGCRVATARHSTSLRLLSSTSRCRKDFVICQTEARSDQNFNDGIETHRREGSST